MSHGLTHNGGLLVLMAAVCLLLSCGGSAMNQTKATAHVKQLAQDTARAIAPDVPTTARAGEPRVGGCGPGFGDKVDVAYSLLLPKLPPESSQQILLAAKAYFERKGYSVIGFLSTGPLPRVNAVTPDDFNLTYVIASDGTSYVGASSPCVSPK